MSETRDGVGSSLDNNWSLLSTSGPSLYILCKGMARLCLKATSYRTRQAKNLVIDERLAKVSD